MSVHDAPPSPHTPATAKLRWDIFCQVIDNFGDAGVCWRLARQLVSEHQQQVQLWVDDLSALAMLVPQIDIGSDSQLVEGVCIRQWRSGWPLEPIADVVIEAFGCTIPQAYVSAMSASMHPVMWLNLEYLSAEAWVEDCHGLPSKLPNQLHKYFFFPGFTGKTGGLLREADLIQRRDQFQADSSAQTAYLNDRGVYPKSGAMIISLFSYENPLLGSWLDTLSLNPDPVCLLVPQGRILGDVQGWLGVDTLKAGDHHQCGMLDIHIQPFTSQDDYDRLLWCCDFNIVRGEDSFVRAQWAGQPMLWHIYPQDEDAHWLKLDAFLDLYTRAFSVGANAALRQFWLDWNRGNDLSASWRTLKDLWPDIKEGSQGWCGQQLGIENISNQIVTFAQEGLIIAAADLA